MIAAKSCAQPGRRKSQKMLAADSSTPAGAHIVPQPGAAAEMIATVRLPVSAMLYNAPADTNPNRAAPNAAPSLIFGRLTCRPNTSASICDYIVDLIVDLVKLPLSLFSRAGPSQLLKRLQNAISMIRKPRSIVCLRRQKLWRHCSNDLWLAACAALKYHLT
jgi:hypothetical protein